MKTFTLTFILLLFSFLHLKSQTPTITADGPTSFCWGDSVQLCINPATYHYYFWSNGGSTRCIIVTHSGNYYATVFDSILHADSSLMLSPVIVTVHNPIPVVYQNGNTLYTDSFNSYQWYLNSILISGAINRYYTATQNGNYSVKVTDSFGCTGISNNIDGWPPNMGIIQP